MIAVLFWAAVALILFTYLLFPALIFLRGRLLSRPYKTAEITPPLSMIIAAHDEAVAAAHGEILVFSDANSMYGPGALRALARPFADPEVGGVAGNQRYLSKKSVSLSG